MKINEKHLCEFAVGSSPITKQGFLNKRGEVNRAFQRRWFVLKANLLFYFERPADHDPIGVIVLDDCLVTAPEGEDAYAFELCFSGSGSRTYVLAATCQEEMEEWMRALASSSYTYVRDTIAELQRQLDDIAASASSSSSDANVSRIDRRPIHARLPQVTSDLPEQPLINFDEEWGRMRYRNFEEMHRDFGMRIQQKMQEQQQYSDNK